MSRVRTILVGAAATVAIAASCTIFDGLDNRVIDADAEAGADAQGDVVLPAGEQPGFLSLADGVAFCSNAFACPNLPTSVEFSIDVPVDPGHFSSCIDWVSGPLPKDRNGVAATAAILQCAAQATSCTAAAGCMWDEVINTNDPRCVGKDGGQGGQCGDDGGSVYFCNSNPGIVHCGNAYFAAGSSCLYDDAGLPWCNRLPCSGQQCLGDMLDYCGTDGMQYSENCALGGFTCGYDSTLGYDDCLTNGSAKKCTALAISCVGATVTICDGAYVADYDCGAYGGTCDASGFPRCARPNETCTPSDADIDVCTGDVISLCVGGQKTTFDCTSIGKTCVAGVSGQSSHCQ
jgi:hypothetical protein